MSNNEVQKNKQEKENVNFYMCMPRRHEGTQLQLHSSQIRH